LFGSYARQTETPQSDVDIAILCEGAHIPDGFQLIAWREALSTLLQKDVDLVCLNSASPIIGMQVYKNGKALLITNPREYARYQTRLFVEYIELKELRAPMEKNILKRKYYDRS
jgi:predicted nucleotidyltransferase